MVERSPIFGKDSTQIGYVEGGEAFDLSGRKRCNYSKETGNLFDDSRRTVGHVSLAGKFVGVFSIADKLFPKFDIAQIELCGIGRTPSQPESEASEVAASADLAAPPSAPDSTEAIQVKDKNEQRVADVERRDISATRGHPISEARQVVALAEEAPSPHDSSEAVQAKDENEQRAADAERRDISRTRGQPLTEARQVAAAAELAEAPSAADPTEAIQIKDKNEQRVADRDSGGTRSQPLSEARQVAAPAELAEAPTTPGPTEAVQAKNENEQRAADAERRDISRTRGQPLTEARQVAAAAELAEAPSAADPTEAIQVKDKNEQRVADVECRDISGTPSQPLTDVALPTELAEAPSAPEPIEAIQLKDENEQRGTDAERRGISGMRSQQLSEASQLATLTEAAEQPRGPDPTEVIQLKDEKGRRAADAERRGIGGTPSQSISEARQVAAPAELAETSTTLDSTEATQAKDENEQRAADAERRDISRTPSQQLSEARQVTPLIEPAERPTAHDAIEAIQIKDENEQHAADRDSSGTRSQLLSEASQAATPAELAEAPTTPDPTEAIQAKDGNEQRAEDAEHRDISRTPSQLLFEARQVTALIDSAEQLTAHDPGEAIQAKDENEQRAADAERRDSSGTPTQLSEASQVAAPAELAEAPTTPSKGIYVQDENGHRSIEAERRGIGGTPSQAISEPSEATTLIGPPEEPSTAGLTEALHSNDAEKARVANVLKSLERSADVKRRRNGGISGQPLSRPSKVSTLTGSPLESSAPNWTETFKRKDTAKDRLVRFVKALKGAANAKRRGSSETLDQPVYGPTKVTMRTISSQESSTPDPSEAFHSKDADKHRLVEILKALGRSADANRRRIDGTPRQSSSTPTKVRTTPTESPAKPSAPDLAEGFHSNDADKDRVVNALKALMKRSRGLIADAPRLQQAEETDLAMTLSVILDPVSPDKPRVQELESRERELKPHLGAAFSAPIDNRLYQGNFATGQQTRPHNAFGTNQQSAPAALADPGAEYPSRASVDTSAAPAAQQLHDASPHTLTPADDNALENARAGRHHRREGGMQPAVEAFMRRLAEFIGTQNNQTATLSSDDAAELKLGASAEASKDADPVPFPGAPDPEVEFERLRATFGTSGRCP